MTDIVGVLKIRASVSSTRELAAFTPAEVLTLADEIERLRVGYRKLAEFADNEIDLHRKALRILVGTTEHMAITYHSSAADRAIANARTVLERDSTP